MTMSTQATHDTGFADIATFLLELLERQDQANPQPVEADERLQSPVSKMCPIRSL